MNKILYISVIIMGFALVSCNKQEIAPNSANTVVVPTWDNERSSVSGDDDSDVSDPTIDDGNNDGTITDPNNDPDGNSTKDD